ncbi:MAG: carboxypeptidase-like regulatory domain-containing protein [Candidatus Bathyarchaeia archaeon]
MNKLVYFSFISAILLLYAMPCIADSLNVSVTLNKQSFSPDETVIISGLVTDSSNRAVPSAIVSIQVNDPNGKMIHIAMVISGADGKFVDQFVVSDGLATGEYKVYVTASKSGYSDTTMQANYTVIPEFQMEDLPALTLIALMTSLLLLKIKIRCTRFLNPLISVLLHHAKPSSKRWRELQTS